MKQLLTSLLLVLTVNTFAQVPPPEPNTYIIDLTKTMHAEQLREVNDSTLALEKRTGVQLAIVFVPDNDLAVEDLTLGIGRTWHVGYSHNGLVYACIIAKRKQRLEVAERLQGTITDADALSITDELKPALRSKDYYSASLLLIKLIKQQIEPAKEEQIALTNQAKQEKDNGWSDVEIIFLIFSIIGVAITIFYFIHKWLTRDEGGIPQWNNPPPAPPNPYPETYSNMAAASMLLQQRQYKAPKEDEEKLYIPPAVSTNDDDDDNRRSSSSSDDSYGNWGGSGSSGFSSGGASNDF